VVGVRRTTAVDHLLAGNGNSTHSATANDGGAGLSEASLLVLLWCFLCDALIELVDVSEQSFAPGVFDVCDRSTTALIALLKPVDDLVNFRVGSVALCPEAIQN
jgi:hypothetical protein